MTSDIESICNLLPNTWQSNTEPFNLNATLMSGQVFRWRRDSLGTWWGTVGRALMGIWQAEGQPYAPIRWQTYPEPNRWDLFNSFFRMDVSLEMLYKDWLRSEPQIAQAISDHCGLRILRQDPAECFFAFQCASCNTVVKIERSVTLLAQRYGTKVVAPQAYRGTMPLHLFPDIHSLSKADEALLRADLWGFRAPRVISLAQILSSKEPGWLESLRSAPYREAHQELASMPGIGAKVADCICLFSLNKDDAVPIDTHTRQIATRLFATEYKLKSLTPSVYNALAESYRTRFGDYSGWAQQYLFFADLHPSTQNRSVAHSGT